MEMVGPQALSESLAVYFRHPDRMTPALARALQVVQARLMEDSDAEVKRVRMEWMDKQGVSK
jgi:hypothetical protein